jgi:protein O-mannosyl-transferase
MGEIKRMSYATTKATRLLHHPALHLLLLALVALIAYSNSFHVPFIFDDEPSISKNELLRDLSNYLGGPAGYDEHPNRFVGYLSFALNYRFGALEVFGYHLVNLAIHLANGMLVYVLARLSLQTPSFVSWKAAAPRSGALPGAAAVAPPDYCSLIPLCAALLFVSHSVQTQAVTYIVQRLTSLATFFYLAAFVLYLRWRSARADGAPLASARVWPAFLLSLLATLLAMKTKEIAFTLPVVILLYEFCFFGPPRLRQLAELVPTFLTLLVIPWTLMSQQPESGGILAGINSATVVETTLSRWDYLCTQFSVIVRYLGLLFFPVNQNFDYDYRASHSLWEPRTFLSLILLLALLGFALWLLYRSSRAARQVAAAAPSSGEPCYAPFLRLAAFGVLWFFVTLSVESSIIPIVDLIYEHRLYLPSVGFLIALATLALVGAQRLALRAPAAAKLVPALLCIAVCLLTAATYARNQVWQSPETLWQDVITKSPQKPRGYDSLGAFYARQRRPAQAIPAFEAAIRLDPKFLSSYYNLAMMYLATGRTGDAKHLYATLRELDPETFKRLEAGDGGKR